MVSRAIYITFYILYLLTLAISLWFVLYYAKVPFWIWSFFGVAILILIICVLFKEFLLTRTVTCCGKDVTTGSGHSAMEIFYIIAVLMVFILFIVGLVFVIIYSTIPWFVWVILFFAILLSIITTMILAFAPDAYIIALVLWVIAFVMFIAGLILLIIYSNSPWWVWLIIGITILFFILAAIFEVMGERNEIIVEDIDGCEPVVVCPRRVVTSCPKAVVSPCSKPAIKTCGKTTIRVPKRILKTQVIETVPPVVVRTTRPVTRTIVVPPENLLALPSAAIPEQTVD
jgi:hypothetical protein